MLTATFSESFSFDGELRFGSTTATLKVLEFNRFSYQAPVAENGCKWNWLGPVFSTSAPFALTIKGAYNLDLPGRSIRLDGNSVPPYRSTTGPIEEDTLTDGPYNYSTTSDFTIAGQAFSVAGSGNYRRDAARAMGLVNNALNDAYLTNGFVTFGQALDAWKTPIPGLIMRYRFSVGNGQMGSHELECNVSGESDEFAESSALVAERYQTIFSQSFPRGGGECHR